MPSLSPHSNFLGLLNKNVCRGVMLYKRDYRVEVSRAMRIRRRRFDIVRNKSANHLLQPNMVSRVSLDFRSTHCCVNVVGVTLIFSQKCMDSRRFHNGKTNIWTWEDRSINLEGRVSYQERKFRFALKSK